LPWGCFYIHVTYVLTGLQPFFCLLNVNTE